MIGAQVVLFVAGLFLVFSVLGSAVRTMVVPRGEQVRLTRWVFQINRKWYLVRAAHKKNDARRASLLAQYAAVSLLTLAATWAVLIIVAFTAMYWSLGKHAWVESLHLSGSSITTLGFVKPEGEIETLLSVIEALLGLGIVALLISYLPTIYGLFNRREAEVTKFDARAGSPPTATEMLVRFHRIGWLDDIDDTWEAWEEWFSLIEESHTSHPSLAFFRSQRPNSSWVTCAGAVLDTAALSLSVLDVKRSAQAAITIRSGFMCLRALAADFDVPFDASPEPNAPISIHREEFDILLATLEEAGLPVVDDHEQAWRDFAGWRVNYDVPLLALCALTDAPATPWSSDRIDGFHRRGLSRAKWKIDPFETPPSW